MKRIQRFLDVVSFVIGPTALLLGIFNFSHREVVGDNSIAVAYSYDEDALVLIAVGSVLIATGVLRKVWARESK